eukprot:UN06574
MQRLNQPVGQRQPFTGAYSNVFPDLYFNSWDKGLYSGGFQYRVVSQKDMTIDLTSDPKKLGPTEGELLMFKQEVDTSDIPPFPNEAKLLQKAELHFKENV